MELAAAAALEVALRHRRHRRRHRLQQALQHHRKLLVVVEEVVVVSKRLRLRPLRRRVAALPARLLEEELEVAEARPPPLTRRRSSSSSNNHKLPPQHHPRRTVIKSAVVAVAVVPTIEPGRLRTITEPRPRSYNARPRYSLPHSRCHGSHALADTHVHALSFCRRNNSHENKLLVSKRNVSALPRSSERAMRSSASNARLLSANELLNSHASEPSSIAAARRSAVRCVSRTSRQRGLVHACIDDGSLLPRPVD